MAAIGGDWYASSRDGDARWIQATQPDGTIYMVAKVWANDDGDFESTARLVSAAPELLEVCKNLAGDFQSLLDGDDFSGMSDRELFGVMLASLTVAINKAEGRSE